MYQTEFNGQHHELGTSGFLYRSNKVMYDHETLSFWSTLTGEPVLGELVDQGIKLNRRHVVTTTWGEWKQRHPTTTVLSLDTGHQRDYGEGQAYSRYFGTDEIMFAVPKLDDRLLNKDEVVALRDGDDQLAIAAKFLDNNPVYHDKIADNPVVVLTDDSGANRVYFSGETKFSAWDKAAFATDDQDRQWKFSEESLTLGEKVLKRAPSHRAFWFGWQSQFPNTRLVK